MDQQLVAEVLTSDSDEIADLKANLDLLDGFINLIRKIDALPDINKRFYEESRSLYQTTAVKRNIADLEKILSEFFGPAVKPADKALPRKLRKSSVIKYLGGIQKDQSLFTVELKTGQFYGALWPWRRNKSNIEIHIGYCSDWMSDEDYYQLETLVNQTVSRGAFKNMNADIGGQIHGISLPSFLQMAEMEKSSFTLRVTSRHRVGALHLSEGNLFAAELDNSTGNEAAYNIISWDDASIDIEPLGVPESDEIKMPLMHLLMESLKLKDEAASVQEPPQSGGLAQTNRQSPQPHSTKRLIRLERVRAPETRRSKISFMTLLGIAVGLFAIVAVIVVVSFHILENRKISEGYGGLRLKLQRTESPEQKIELLNNYLEEYPNSAYDADIRSRIVEARQSIEDRAFEQATLKVSGLPLDEHYEAKSIEIYRQFLKEYPDSRHTDKVNQSIVEIKNLLDQYYYEELKRAAQLDFNKRLESYRKYLQQFPSGKYRDDVEILINEMGVKYLTFLKEESKACEESSRYESCIKHAENFLVAYNGRELSKKAQVLKTELIDKRDYDQLVRSAEDLGTNYQKAHQEFSAYLKEHPQTTQRNRIEKQLTRLSANMKVQRKWSVVEQFAQNPKNDLLARIQKIERYVKRNANSEYAGEAQTLLARLEQERRISLRRHQRDSKKRTEQARLQRQREEQERRRQRATKFQAVIENQLKGSQRYRSNGDGTFTDLTTGLTWAILDSYQELSGCLTYDEAIKYIRTLQHGGRRSWRMPTAYELAGINKKAPYFPASGAEWYWSSETSVKGYHTVADIVTAVQESKFQRVQRPITDCGAVRAVLIP